MNNLKLITTETFGDLPCNFYRNMNDDVLLTREQIGTALEYSNPCKAIQKIHSTHKDRLEPLCIRIIENRYPQNGGVGVDVETIYYTQRGVMEICRFSHQPKANIFMDWVWDIVEQYRNNELSLNTKFNDQFLSTINNINTSLNTALLSLDDRLSKLETKLESNLETKLASMLESILATKPDSNNVATITITNPQSNPQSNTSATNTPKILPYKYSNWKSNTFEKLKTLTNFVNSNSDQNLTLSNTMKLVFKEMENTYNVDLSEYTFMYKCEFNLPEDDKAQALDVINYYKDLRDMLDFTLNSIMDKLNLKLTNTVTRNIFDELAERLQFAN